MKSFSFMQTPLHFSIADSRITNYFSIHHRCSRIVDHGMPGVFEREEMLIRLQKGIPSSDLQGKISVSQLRNAWSGRLGRVAGLLAETPGASCHTAQASRVVKSTGSACCPNVHRPAYTIPEPQQRNSNPSPSQVVYAWSQWLRRACLKTLDGGEKYFTTKIRTRTGVCLR